MFVYCPKCGHLERLGSSGSCPVCGHIRYFVPQEYLSKNGNLFASQQIRTDFIHNVIEKNPEYDPQLAVRKDQILQTRQQQHQQQVAQKVSQYQASRPVPKCPVCGSTSLSAISTVGKFAKIYAFGLYGAGDLGKQRRCNSCGHKF